MEPRLLRLLLPLVLAPAALACAQEIKPQEVKPKITYARQDPVDYPEPRMLNETGKLRLRMERQVMGKQLLELATWHHEVVKKHVPEVDSEKVQGLVTQMEAGANDTVQDNIVRFAQAAAGRIPKFADGWTAFQARQYSKAISAWEPLFVEKVGLKHSRAHNTLPPYLYVLVKFLTAESQAREGVLSDAAVSYMVAYEVAGSSLTFSAPAHVRLGLIYEQTGRIHFAIPILKEGLHTFSEYLSDVENTRMATKIAVLEREKDPYRLALAQTLACQSRLERLEFGPASQQAQKDLMKLLTAMLPQPESEDRLFLEHTQSIAQGADKGKLETGKSPDPLNLLDDVNKTGNDDWGKLPPRERQKLIEAFKEMYPERYTEMLEAYYKGLSDAENLAVKKD